jgi:hypothetical protein
MVFVKHDLQGERGRSCGHAYRARRLHAASCAPARRQPRLSSGLWPVVPRNRARNTNSRSEAVPLRPTRSCEAQGRPLQPTRSCEAQGRPLQPTRPPSTDSPVRGSGQALRPTRPCEAQQALRRLAARGSGQALATDSPVRANEAQGERVNVHAVETRTTNTPFVLSCVEARTAEALPFPPSTDSPVRGSGQALATDSPVRGSGQALRPTRPCEAQGERKNRSY